MTRVDEEDFFTERKFEEEMILSIDHQNKQKPVANVELIKMAYEPRYRFMYLNLVNSFLRRYVEKLVNETRSSVPKTPCLCADRAGFRPLDLKHKK